MQWVDSSKKGQREMTTIRTFTAALLATLALLSAAAGTATADFGVTGFAGAATHPDGTRNAQAGAHPDLVTQIDFSAATNEYGLSEADGNVKDVVVDLPPGVVGNPTVAPTCDRSLLSRGFFTLARCPIESQVGIAHVSFAFVGQILTEPVPIYRFEPPRSVPALFAFNVLGVVAVLTPELRGHDYGLTVRTPNVSQGLAITGTRITLWGVPADPVHDAQRWRPNPAVEDDGAFGTSSASERRPFTTAPTNCSAGPLTTSIRARSWQRPDVWSEASFDTDFDGLPLQVEGCDRLPFAPEVEIAPTVTAPDAPTGLDVSIEIPQHLDNPDGLAASHLRDVKVTLPEGMTINPGSAGGLGACDDAQLGLGDNSPARCPDNARIGSVTAKSPLLEEDLTGGVYIRSQASGDPESGEMFRLALALENVERGVYVKLGGAVRVSAATGRIVTEFEDNPQLPVERIALTLKSGARAPLANPDTCGEKAIDTTLTSWSSQTVERRSTFTVPCADGLGSFAPDFTAGTVSPIAGVASPFALRIDKPDGQSDLDAVTLSLPKGLLANLKGNVGQRVGTARVAAGPGASPFWLSGPVVLEGPYGDAPFSLRVTVPAVAGPFDLGEVVVRQKIYVDPETAQVSIVSDPLPTIVKGVPVRLQSLDVAVDMPGFTINPTSCEPATIDGTLGSSAGQSVPVSTRFQVGECASLGFAPRLAMRATGRKQTRTGHHPGLRAVLTQPTGQANVGRAKVTLPPSIVLDPTNTHDPELLCGYDESLRASCPASTVIGRATAHSPVLNRPLTGDVHLVQGIKFGPTGNRLRTTPSLLVKLRGEVAINLRARSDVRDGRLVTTFASVPDAPVSRFAMKIAGGKNGILVVTRTRRTKIDLCRSRQVADVETDGHNGKQADYRTTVKTPCRKKAARKAKRSGGSRR